MSEEMTKRAFLVVGPESSGTRLITRLFIGAGCYGDDGANQRLDREIPEGIGPIVWRRSVPHAREWLDLQGIVSLLQGRGFDDIHVVVTTRDWFAAARSQVGAGHVKDLAEAYGNMQRAYVQIFSQLGDSSISFTVVGYEALVCRPNAVVARLMRRLALRIPDVDIYDGNEKWYKND